MLEKKNYFIDNYLNSLLSSSRSKKRNNNIINPDSKFIKFSTFNMHKYSSPTANDNLNTSKKRKGH